MTEHVCDPTGDPCPPWAHPYASTDEIVERQNRATAERLNSQPPRRPHIPSRPVGVVPRLVDQWLRTLADLQQRGYVLTSQQRAMLTEIMARQVTPCLALIRRLALGVESERELAEAFAVAPSSIHEFRVKPENVRAIEKRRAQIENDLAGLWSAELCNRIAELEADVDRLTDAMEQAPAELLPRLVSVKRWCLREIAEQLGELGPRQITVGTTVRYEIVGVDMDALQ